MRTATVVWKDSQFSTICGYIGKACIFSIHYSGEQGDDVRIAYKPANALMSVNLSSVYDVKAIERSLDGAKNVVFHPILYPPNRLFLFYLLASPEPTPAATG